MRVLVDMNLSPAWVMFFAEHGIEAVHWSTVGDVAAPDERIMEYAAQSRFVVFTHDLDFGRLLALSTSPSPSVIQVRTQDVLPAAIGGIVMRAIQEARDQLERGALLTVELDRARIRILPI